MHILRIDYKTGLRIDFGFLEKRAASEALSAIDEAKAGTMVLIIDDHGHEGHIVKDGVLACVLTDLAAEVQGQIDVQAAIEGVKGANGLMPPVRITPGGPGAPVPGWPMPAREDGPKPPFSA